MSNLLNLFNALVTWSSNFEDEPESGDSPSYGDDEIRLLKEAVRERLEKEHTMDLTTGTSGSDGWHKGGVAKVYYQASAPTTRPDGTTALTAADNGRLWIRSNDYRVKFYVHPDWVEATTINGADNELTGDNTFSGDNTFNGIIKGELSIRPSGYSIGDTGPAGGIVFYDKGSFSDGWRYMEFAPEETEKRFVRWMSGAYSFETDVTATAIGTGFKNTIDLLAYSSDTVDYLPSAALAARAVTYGGYGDWFLPSKDELDAIYTSGVSDFPENIYWSSSEDAAGNAWEQFFSNGSQYNSYKYNGNRVRAIRRF